MWRCGDLMVADDVVMLVMWLHYCLLGNKHPFGFNMSAK